MAGFRRPELEKDNPTAPQMYVGPRRRRALARAASFPQAAAPESMTETLEMLTAAAERFVATVPPARRQTHEGKALLKAITHARQYLAEEIPSSFVPREA
jgi:hypothetical protein